VGRYRIKQLAAEARRTERFATHGRADCSKKIRSRTLTRNVADRSRGSNGKTSPGLLAPPKKQPESPELPCALLKQELRGRKLSDSRTHHSLVDQEERARFIEFCGNAVERKVTIV
jgi:hypothetical protein